MVRGSPTILEANPTAPNASTPAPPAAPQSTGFQPKFGFDPRHKVISFGTVIAAESPEEEKLYSFVHQRADLKVSRGSLPVGFLSSLAIDEGQPVYLETRDGGINERNLPIGPQYQVSWKFEREVIAAGSVDGWSTDLDELWRDVLAYFEKKNLLSENTLEDLDADPFVLFGIDDPITQQALLKLAKFPALRCDEETPNLDEWSAYLRIDPLDTQLQWLVKAFSETDLPKPWTCYKGVGSIVCYIRSDTGDVTWKHPFYDYFRQLRDFCRQASKDEVMQVRCNRLLWSYEATRIETEHDQEPLVSPEYIRKMADIFGYDVSKQGYLVRNLKAQLKVFARSYREKQDIDIAGVGHCADLLHRDLEKYHLMKEHWQSKVADEMQFDLNTLANGEVECVNCGSVALSFCLECKDYLCLNCYNTLHSKGSRLLHSPFRLVACGLCVVMPAKLHCTFTDKSLCHKCYAMKHIKMLPPDGKENQPRRIDYIQQYRKYSEQARDRAGAARRPGEEGAGPPPEDSYESVLSTDWHPFYDARGVKYYYNFITQERMRQSPQREPNARDAGAEEFGDGSELAGGALSGPLALGSTAGLRGPSPRSTRGFMNTDSSQQGMKLVGFDALETYPPSHVTAALQPDARALRPPHRVHMPHEVPAS